MSGLDPPEGTLLVAEWAKGVALWWTRVRLKTDFDPDAKRTTLMCYRQLVMRHRNEQVVAERHMNEQLVAERIANANHTAEEFDRIGHIYLSPDRFSKIDQFHSIADKMGDVFVEYNHPQVNTSG